MSILYTLDCTSRYPAVVPPQSIFHHIQIILGSLLPRPRTSPEPFEPSPKLVLSLLRGLRTSPETSSDPSRRSSNPSPRPLSQAFELPVKAFEPFPRKNCSIFSPKSAFGALKHLHERYPEALTLVAGPTPPPAPVTRHERYLCLRRPLKNGRTHGRTDIHRGPIILM